MNRESIRVLEQVLLATWPAAEVTEMDGWVLSANNGATGRANSATVLGPADRSVAQSVEWMEQWYRDRDLVPMIRASPLCAPGVVDYLEARGYGPWPAACDILLRPLESTAPDPAVSLDSEATDRWFSLSERPESMWPDLRAMSGRVLGAVAFASVSTKGQVIAIGQGVVARDHLAIYGMSTAREQRGRGLGKRIIGALEAWAVSAGAARATLQVTIENTPAQGLYRGLGYEPVYQYRYLRAPA